MLGLPRNGSAPVRLGGSAVSAGAGAVKVGLSRKVRRALARSRGAKATLAASSGSVSLARTVTLRPELRPARVASHGLKLAAICSDRCTIASRLIVSGAGARRLGIRSGGRSVAIGSARVDASASAARTFTVRIARGVRRALSRAKRADLTLEVTVSGENTASRRTTRRVTLG
jgi:hypothetical protein